LILRLLAGRSSGAPMKAWATNSVHGSGTTSVRGFRNSRA